jgi:hypothetical protein
LIRSRINDEIPEVGYAAWWSLCLNQDELHFCWMNFPGPRLPPMPTCASINWSESTATTPT